MRITELGKNNTIIGKPKEESAFTIQFNGNNSKVIIEKNVVFKNVNLKLYNNSIIKICEDGYIRGSMLAHNDCKIELGKSLRCNSYLNISTAEKTSVIIGDDCLVAEAVIRSSDMHPIFDATSGERLNSGKSVYIGNRVWLGQECIINKGLKISDDSVVGIRSVVTKSFNESNVVIAGIPAKIVKSNIIWHKKL